MLKGYCSINKPQHCYTKTMKFGAGLAVTSKPDWQRNGFNKFTEVENQSGSLLNMVRTVCVCVGGGRIPKLWYSTTTLPGLTDPNGISSLRKKAVCSIPHRRLPSPASLKKKKKIVTHQLCRQGVWFRSTLPTSATFVKSLEFWASVPSSARAKPSPAVS